MPVFFKWKHINIPFLTYFAQGEIAISVIALAWGCLECYEQAMIRAKTDASPLAILSAS